MALQLHPSRVLRQPDGSPCLNTHRNSRSSVPKKPISNSVTITLPDKFGTSPLQNEGFRDRCHRYLRILTSSLDIMAPCSPASARTAGSLMSRPSSEDARRISVINEN